MTEQALNVLLVDDDEIDRLLVQRSLKQAQPLMMVSITEAKDAKSSVELLKNGRFDCVLLDFNLPDASGLEVLKEYKKHDPDDTPVVMLSGLDDEKLILECLKQGAQDYLIKSEVNSRTMLRSIRYAMERRKSTKLAETVEVAVAAEKEMNLFLARMSHEVRTPLNTIFGFAELMKMGIGEDSLAKQQMFANEILNAGRRLDSLIYNIMDLVDIRQQLNSLSSESCNLGQIIESSAVEAQAIAAKAGITIHTEASPLFAKVNPKRLQQVIAHLLSNAIKFNHEFGSVMLQVRESGEEHVEVCVRDTGVGMEEDEQSEIFKPFTRLEYAQNRAIDGTGIGLTLCKTLVEEMNGSIEVDSQSGKGAVFTLRFERAA